MQSECKDRKGRIVSTFRKTGIVYIQKKQERADPGGTTVKKPGNSGARRPGLFPGFSDGCLSEQIFDL